MKYFLLISLCFAALNYTNAQKFITSGTIEFEARTNVPKTVLWDDDDDFMQQIKDKLPQFSYNYYTYTFTNNKSFYKFSRNTDTKKVPEWLSVGQEENIYFTDFNTGKFVDKKAIRWDDTYLISGEVKPQQWKISPNDNTVIAGFNCRKASTVLFDSVYVFAYYTDEIAISGGPMSLNGLPGMILGVTIPRMYTSWLATNIILSNADEASIIPPTKGKKKSDDELKNLFNDMRKSWSKEQLKYFNNIYWKAFL